MKKSHKVIIVLIFLCTFLISLFYKIYISEVVSQNLVTFFSVVFGFYITSIAVLYNSSFIKRIYKEIDLKDNTKRKIDTLKKYFLIVGRHSIISITTIILYNIIETNTGNILSLRIPDIPFFNLVLDINLLINGFILGVSSINIFYMFLILNVVLNGMKEEARK